MNFNLSGIGGTYAKKRATLEARASMDAKYCAGLAASASEVPAPVEALVVGVGVGAVVEVESVSVAAEDALVSASQLMFAHKLGSDVSVASEGWETPVVQHGASPELSVHTQHGSPSSWPLVCPSPSVSAWHSDTVHSLPAFSKAFPNAFVGLCPLS